MLFIYMFIMKLSYKNAQWMESVTINWHQQWYCWKHQSCHSIINIHTNQFDYQSCLCYLQVKSYEPIKSFYRTYQTKKTDWIHAIILAMFMGTYNSVWFFFWLKNLFFLLITIFFRICFNEICWMYSKWYSW